jgi:hypothetical protein
MPTIEIVSIDSTGLGYNQADFDVAIIEENQLKSHRGLFYTFLKKQNGVIVHVGNPDFKKDKEGEFFAGAIVDWNVNQQFMFRFLDQYKRDIDTLLKIALDKSPIQKIYFLTDYQFGAGKENIEIIYTIKDFWKRHDTKGLRFNTLYEMYGQ